MITVLLADESPAALAEGEEVRLTGPTYRHLFRARRLPRGTDLRVTDGLGHAWWAQVTSLDERTAVLVVGGAAPSHESRLRVTLLVPTLRPERATWLIEKATELGVDTVRFILSERAPREPGANTLARLRRVAAAALEQCHRAQCPAISGPHAWSDLASLSGDAQWRGVLDPEAAVGWPPHLAPVRARATLLIGAEGGWTATEREQLRASSWQPVGLGERILRIETAALAGAALLLLPSVPAGASEVSAGTS